jgi:hypothetical protein
MHYECIVVLCARCTYVCNRDVVVYRMITAGTVEEKMYEKQVFVS